MTPCVWPNADEPDIAVNIDGVADQKLYAASAHESQFFEWLPWLDGTLDKVPADSAERLKFMKVWLWQPTDAVRKCLKSWYDEPGVSKIVNAEAFKLADYSRKPGHEELLKLFPIIK